MKSPFVSFIFSRKPLTLLMAGAFLVAVGTETYAAAPASSEPQPLVERLRLAAPSGDQGKLTSAGIEYLLKKDLQKASMVLNSALKLDPTSSYVQLLNGLAYHLMANEGDADKYGLAEQGYRLAVQFDKSNWLARYFLGNLHLDQKQYAAAQAIFAEALLFSANDEDMLYQLATASYYAGDPTTAAAALGRLDGLSPNQPRVMRAMSIVMAALNKPLEAQGFLDRYKATQTDQRATSRFEERVKSWSRMHGGGPNFLKTQFPPATAAGSSAFPPDTDPASVAGGFPAAGQDAGIFPDAPPPGEFGGNAAGSVVAMAPAGVAPSGGERMVLVDVVILRTEDLITTRKGVNLLSSLSLQFGSSSAPAYSQSVSRSEASADTGNTFSRSNTLTRAITIPALTYSLNIVNAGSGSNEILARPTIAALEGAKSEFFSGTNLNAGVVGPASATSAGSIQIDKEIGVRLAITPTFLDKDRVRINVMAERTFLQTPSGDVNFTYKIETSKTTVNAQTVLNFGETLILSGLSEKETSNTRDGVPVLQDIPILQYLFSKADTRAFQRSVLILLTPRRAEYVYRDETSTAKGGVIGSKDSAALSELRARYIDWFKPYPNLASVFHHLGSTALYREFRTGDVTLEKWAKEATLTERLHQVVDFLYY